MNKNILFGAATILFCSFFALVSFKGKTKEQQLQEITAAVEAKISELRTSKVDECNARVLEAATIKYNEILEAEAEAAKSASKKRSIRSKKKTYTAPKAPTQVDPVPTAPTTPPPPPPPAPNPKSDKMNKEEVKNTAEKASKMAKQPNIDKKKSKMNKGGGN